METNLSEYRIKWLIKQPLDTWIDIKVVPSLIGFYGIIDAFGSKVLDEIGYEMKLNKYCSHFMIKKKEKCNILTEFKIA